jgi:ribosomal protein L11 methylase PrmA
VFDSVSNSAGSTDPVWTLVDLVVDGPSSETVSDFLWCHGVAAIEERTIDAATILRTSTGVDVELLRAVPGVLAVDLVDMPRSVADTWRQHARPSPVAAGLAIVPAWCRHDWPEEDSVWVEPGDAFGVGNHVTTLLAARLLLRHAVPGSEIFDFGCGTGVLAILVARHLGCRASVWDIAPGCRSVVGENVRLNQLEPDLVRWMAPHDSGPHAMVVANILAPVLRAESATITDLCRPGGTIVLSGMRSEQVQGVTAAFGLPVVDSMEEDGWEAVVLRHAPSDGA